MIRVGKGLAISKAQSIKKLVEAGWTVKLAMKGHRSAILLSPDGHEHYGEPRDMLSGDSACNCSKKEQKS